MAGSAMPARALHDAGGVVLNYARTGSGEPVVLLHGWPQSGQEWEGLAPLLADRYDVIAVDLRGMGDSSRPLAGYDVESVARDVASLIGALRLERPRIVGHDLGGPVGYVLASDPALRARQFAFIEAPLYGVEAEGVAEAMAKAWHIPFFTVPHVAEFLIAGREAEFIDYFMRAFAYDKAVATAERVAQYARTMRQPGALVSGLAYYRAAERSAGQIAEIRGRGKLAVPVLALGGEACLGGACLSMMRAVADDVQGGVVERCGHWMAEERPEELARLLREFFAKG